MATRVRSFSKINIGLRVGPARPDGFHALTTVYQTLALCDFVTVSARPASTTRITLTANHPGVPRSETNNAERNTAWKIVAGALTRMGITAEVTIAIDKQLPVQGGMGAGSANAIAALLGLERELGCALPRPERLQLAAEVGSDVPLFLLGGTVLGLGRGEQVYPLPDLPATHCVMAIPTVGVSTALAFRELDQRQAPPDWVPSDATTTADSAPTLLTFQQLEHRLEELSRSLAAVWTPVGAGASPTGITRAGEAAGSETISRPDREPSEGDLAENPLLALVRTGIENDFEKVAFSQHPSLRPIKRELMGDSSQPAGAAICAALSGSGSALFGLYKTEAAAREAQRRVQAAGTRAILTETLPRQRYWHTMFAE
jgi:4-diphosphocytidyl-2-C-methyl-D-erythritol kinase